MSKIATIHKYGHSPKWKIFQSEDSWGYIKVLTLFSFNYREVATMPVMTFLVSFMVNSSSFQIKPSLLTFHMLLLIIAFFVMMF